MTDRMSINFEEDDKNIIKAQSEDEASSWYRLSTINVVPYEKEPENITVLKKSKFKYGIHKIPKDFKDVADFHQ